MRLLEGSDARGIASFVSPIILLGEKLLEPQPACQFNLIFDVDN